MTAMTMRCKYCGYTRFWETPRRYTCTACGAHFYLRKGVSPDGSDWDECIAFEVFEGILNGYHGDGGDVVIPDTVKHITAKCFQGCDSMTSVTIPDSLRYIEDGTFDRCRGLKTIRIRGMELQVAAIRRYSRELEDPDDWYDDEERSCFSECLNMILDGDYTKDKQAYPVMAMQICADHPEDAVTRSFVRAHFSEGFGAFALHASPEQIMRLMQADGILTPDNIDICIETAIQYELHEVQLFLMNYKEEHFGFTAPEDRFRL